MKLEEISIEICILKNRFSHSKLIIIDKEIASVGSGNFDYRSFEHNYEINTLIYDKELAIQLSDNFESNKENCDILDYDSFKSRPTHKKLLE